MSDDQKPRISLRLRADRVRGFRCRHLIVVLENPADPLNIGVVIRNANALGVDKVYIVDEEALLPDDWQVMRQTSWLSKTSASAVKWSFVKTSSACVAPGKNGLTRWPQPPGLRRAWRDYPPGWAETGAKQRWLDTTLLRQHPGES
ncbi:MAG: hypothetical protein IPJ58_11165 [Ardenticatenia bacterium]|nr:hypothetical protein [Ardenticatenia bacterium]